MKIIFLAQTFITLKDFIIAPILLILILAFGSIYSRKKYAKPYRGYFMRGLQVRLAGSLALGLITQYYFGGGDTYYYYAGASSFTSNFFTRFGDTMQILWNNSEFLKSYPYTSLYFTKVSGLLYRDSALIVMKIGGIIGLFTFNSYLGTALIFASFAFVGSWKIFKVFDSLYPHLHKQFAMATLYIPSVIFWGAGYLKDPLIMGFLGIMFYSSYQAVIKRKKIFKYSIIAIICAYYIIQIKVYVFLAFFPALVFWVVITYKNRIRSRALRNLSMPIFLLLTVFIGFFAIQKITSMDKFKEYSMEQAAEKATEMLDYYDKINRNFEIKGKASISNFSIGAFEPTPMGMIKKFPVAVNAVLYRPYPWEVIKLVNVPAAIESFIFLAFTLIVLFKRKIIFFFTDILKNPDILFCVMFTLVFAFIVGIGTSNFGTLVRYKIPCLPFFLIAMFILKSKTKAIKA